MKNVNTWTQHWRRLEVRLNPRQGYSQHPANYQIPEAWFRQYLVDYDFWFITNGQEILVDKLGNEYPLRRGTGLLFQPNSIWSSKPTPQPAKPLEMFYFHFDLWDTQTGKIVDPEEMREYPTVYHSHEASFVESTCRRILQLGYQWKSIKQYSLSPHYRTACDLLKVLIGDIILQERTLYPSSPRGIDPIRYSDMMSLMTNLSDDPQYYESVEAMAKEVHMSPDHMSRQFKQIFGKSPIEALIESRIERACNLLAGTQLSVAQIAEEVGYEHLHYFSRQFKQKMGQSPLAYRKASMPILLK